MGHDFDFGEDSPTKDRLRQFIRRYRKRLLVVLVVGLFLGVFILVVIGLLLFQVIVPMLLGSTDSTAIQSWLAPLKEWLPQLMETDLLSWILLFFKVGG